MPRPLRVALCQFASAQGDVEANIARMESFVGQAAADKADLIVFPEFVLHGTAVSEQPHLAEQTEESMERLCRAAAKHSIDVVGGFVEKRQLHERDDALINVACYIDKTGTVLSRYTKKNLWHPERDYLEAGTDERHVFKTDKFVAGFLICWHVLKQVALTLTGTLPGPRPPER